LNSLSAPARARAPARTFYREEEDARALALVAGWRELSAKYRTANRAICGFAESQSILN
jgi:hypothetical protein